jgi:regulator of cell morphogenesis and NO signaling
MTISEQTSVGAIAATVPGSVRVFERHGVDFCCGGGKSLALACEEAGLSVADITEEIAAAAATPAAGVTDWTHQPLGRIVDHILATYHAPLHDGLPVIESLAAKVVRAHGARSPAFARIDAIVRELAADLNTHMHKEEVVLFPMIRGIEAGKAAPNPLDAPIGVMEAEHDHAGALLQQLRTLTEDYVPPAYACQTLRALYAQLDELERAMHLHVHLENNVLFPRAIELAHRQTSRP